MGGMRGRKVVNGWVERWGSWLRNDRKGRIDGGGEKMKLLGRSVV